MNIPEEIVNKLTKIAKNAVNEMCGRTDNTEYAIIINKDGEIYTAFRIYGNEGEEEFKGKAKKIASFRPWSPDNFDDHECSDDEYIEWAIDETRPNGEFKDLSYLMEDIEKYCNENGIDEIVVLED